MLNSFNLIDWDAKEPWPLNGLSKRQILEIKVYLQEGRLLQKDIAKIYNVYPSAISKINTGHAGSYLTGWTPENRREFIKDNIKLREDMPRIRNFFKEGCSDSSIATLYGVSIQSIKAIRLHRGCLQDTA